MNKDSRRFGAFPLTGTPDEKSLYINRDYQEAYVTMRWGVKTRRRVVVVTGDPGTGKSELVAMTLRNFEENIVAARTSVKSDQSFAQLLGALLAEYGLPIPFGKVTQLQRLLRFFVEQDRGGRIVALFLDDAHHADRRLLEELAILNGFGKNNFPQIVLVGRPELAATLREPGVRLGAQVGARSQIQPLDANEVERFIDHQLRAARSEGKNIFNAAAVAQIAKLSNGIPRLINTLCDRALQIADARTESKISAKIVSTAAAELGLAKPDAVSRQLSTRFVESKGTAAASARRHERCLSQPDGSGRSRPQRSVPVEPSMQRSRSKRWLVATGVATTVLLLVGAGLLSNFNPPPGLQQMTGQNSETAGTRTSSESSTFRNLQARVGSVSPEEFAPALIRETALKALLHVPGAGLRAQDPVAPEPTRQEGIVFLHTSAAEDLSALTRLRELLIENGFKTREVRLSHSPTGGDVRFFFSQDRGPAEKIKSTLQKALNQRGYQISLELLQRDGAKFEFAAPGNIEVWLPPLSGRTTMTSARTS